MLAGGRPAFVWRVQVADTETPVAAALKLIEPGRGDFLLESVEGGATRGRHSLIGLAPDLVLRARGVECALLSAGESSIAALGSHPLGGKWPLSIPDPARPGAELILLEIEDQSVSISATVGAGAAAPGRAAMVRPSDGGIVTAPATAVVVDESGAVAEAMSTALIVAPRSAARRLINLRRDCRHLFTHEGVPLVQAGAYGNQAL